MLMYSESLQYHVEEFKKRNRIFVDAFRGMERVLGSGLLEKVPGLNKDHPSYELYIRRIERLSKYVQCVLGGVIPKESVFLISGPARSGKDFFCRALRHAFITFFQQPKNQKYTFEFIGLEKLGLGCGHDTVTSQTYEDPMILAMNLVWPPEENKDLLTKKFRLPADEVESLYHRCPYYKPPRPLGSYSCYLWQWIKESVGYDIDKALDHIQIVPVRPLVTNGVLSTNHCLRDELLQSPSDLIGELRGEPLITPDDPFYYDLKSGTVARVAGGGLHIFYEIFKAKAPVFNAHNEVIEKQKIRLSCFEWPIDTLFIATSNEQEANLYFKWGILDPDHIAIVSLKEWTGSIAQAVFCKMNKTE